METNLCFPRGCAHLAGQDTAGTVEPRAEQRSAWQHVGLVLGGDRQTPGPQRAVPPRTPPAVGTCRKGPGNAQ